MFTYGKEIPLEEVVYPTTMELNTLSKEPKEFTFTYGKDIFSEDQMNK